MRFLDLFDCGATSRVIASLQHQIIDLERKLKDQKREPEPALPLVGAEIMGYFHFLPETPIEVLVERPNGQMLLLRHPGFPEEQDAIDFAEKMTKLNPHLRFVIYKPIRIFEADIPVTNGEYFSHSGGF